MVHCADTLDALAALLLCIFLQFLLNHLLLLFLQEALLVQKLFRLVFLGLTLADGEQLLVPTLVSLVGKCLTAAQQQRDPLAYLQLLRILFKHCHASRYRTALPLGIPIWWSPCFRVEDLLVGRSPSCMACTTHGERMMAARE
jgi:hypothetical protein